jgi:hypothetical protein
VRFNLPCSLVSDIDDSGGHLVGWWEAAVGSLGRRRACCSERRDRAGDDFERLAEAGRYCDEALIGIHRGRSILLATDLGLRSDKGFKVHLMLSTSARHHRTWGRHGTITAADESGPTLYATK